MGLILAISSWGQAHLGVKASLNAHDRWQHLGVKTSLGDILGSADMLRGHLGADILGSKLLSMHMIGNDRSSASGFRSLARPACCQTGTDDWDLCEEDDRRSASVPSRAFAARLGPVLAVQNQCGASVSEP